MDVKSILSSLDGESKVSLLTGKNFWETADFPDKGIRPVCFSDGPSGLRKQAGSADHMGVNKSLKATCFPTSSAMAGSWDEELCEKLGRALGEEAAAQGVDVVLAPAVNIKRNPLCGRNFEYFSEDPYLSGKLGAAYVRGIQSAGVTACVKHFAANNREYRRMTSDSIVDERTLREIYLTPFEIAVKEGGAGAVMTAYNKINGVHCHENPALVKGILRGEWGFDGLVVSDWGGCADAVAGVAAGSDLEMPGCRQAAEDIAEAVKSGKLGVEDADRSAGRVLRLALKPRAEKLPPAADHRKIAAECAEGSAVLLQNNGALPLKEGMKVAYIGIFAKKPKIQGAGSSKVNPAATVSPLAAAKGVRYAKGYRAGGGKSSRLLKRAVKLARRCDATVFFAGCRETDETEGLDRKDIFIPGNQKKLYAALRANCKNLVTVLVSGGVTETGWCRSSDAVLYTGLAGQECGEALKNLLWGKVNPSGKLAESFPEDYGDCPSADFFPGSGAAAEYREALFTGYRYYGTAGIKTAFPFGHGLSYTRFDYSDLSADGDGVSFTLTNAGPVDGAETAQLYAGAAESALFRPAKELKGFRKVFLRAGESERVFIPFDDKTFRYFDCGTGRFETEEGNYILSVGSSSEDIRLRTELHVSGKTPESRADELPHYYSGRVKEVTREEFVKLSGRTAENPPVDCGKKKRITVDADTAVCDLKYAKGAAGRAFCRLVRFLIAFLGAAGFKKASVTVKAGLYYVPVRAVAKFCKLSRRKTEGLTEMFNGRFFAGLRKMITKNSLH